MNQKKINRQSHTGKTPFEKEAYKNFISSKFYLDKTEKDPVNTDKSDNSSFEENKNEVSKISRKSLSLTIKDFFSNNWVVTVIGGIMVGIFLLLFSGYVKIPFNIAVNNEKISTIERNIEKINDKIDSNQKDFNYFKETYIVFKTELSKDIEYIKRKINF